MPLTTLATLPHKITHEARHDHLPRAPRFAPNGHPPETHDLPRFNRESGLEICNVWWCDRRHSTDTLTVMILFPLFQVSASASLTHTVPSNIHFFLATQITSSPKVYANKEPSQETHVVAVCWFCYIYPHRAPGYVYRSWKVEICKVPKSLFAS